MPLLKIKNNHYFKQLAEAFVKKDVEGGNIMLVRFHEKALVCLYGGADGEGLDALRYGRFCEKVCTFAYYCTSAHSFPTSALVRYPQVMLFTGTIYCIDA